MTEAATSLRNHFVILGHGRLAKRISRELVASRRTFVIIDPAPASSTSGVRATVLNGDPASPELLAKAAIGEAAGVFAALPDDAQNARAASAVRAISPKTPVIARALLEGGENELRDAGCHRIVLTEDAAGVQMVAAALRPQVAHVLELLSQPGRLELEIGEVRIAPGSTLAGCSFDKATALAQNAILVAIERAGETRYSPPAAEKILAGDVVVVLGARPQIDALQAMGRA